MFCCYVPVMDLYISMFSALMISLLYLCSWCRIFSAKFVLNAMQYKDCVSCNTPQWRETSFYGVVSACIHFFMWFFTLMVKKDECESVPAWIKLIWNNQSAGLCISQGSGQVITSIIAILGMIHETSMHTKCANSPKQQIKHQFLVIECYNQCYMPLDSTQINLLPSNMSMAWHNHSLLK